MTLVADYRRWREVEEEHAGLRWKVDGLTCEKQLSMMSRNRGLPIECLLTSRDVSQSVAYERSAMKKKTKARLDQMEQRLQQLAEMVQELKGQRHAAEGVRKRDVGPGAPRAKAIAAKKVATPSTAAAAKQVAAANPPQATSASVRNSAQNRARTPTKKKVAGTAQRPVNAKPAAKSAPKSTVTFQQKSTRPSIPKPSGEPAAALSDPKPPTPVMGEAGKGGEFSA